MKVVVAQRAYKAVNSKTKGAYRLVTDVVTKRAYKAVYNKNKRAYKSEMM